MGQGRLIALDGLRGVAALAVMLMHARLAALPVGHGYLAVDFFFLLSGYVIAKSYEAPLREGELGLGGYIRVRLERLYPMLALGGMLGLGLFAVGMTPFAPVDQADFLRGVLGQFLLVPFLCTAASFAFNGAQWSIVLELAANLLHAALLRHLGTRRLGWLVAISALLVFAASLHWGGLDLGWQRETFLPGLARVLFGFFGGVWLYRTRERWQARVPRTPLAVPALALMLATGFGRSAGELTWLYDPVMTLLVLPCLLMLGARAKGGRVASALGTLSFPLYAIHLQTLEGLHAWGASQPLLWIAAVLLVAISWLIGGLIDEPLSAWFRLRRRMRGQRGALVVA